MADIAFLITRSSTPCDPATVVQHASDLSLKLAISPNDNSSNGATELLSFSCNDGRPGMLVCTFLPVPHPDASSLPVGALSPTADELAEGRSHIILVGFGVEGTPEERDAVMYLFAAAVARSTDAVGAMLGSATSLHRADAFLDLVAQIPEHGIPPELNVQPQDPETT